VDATENKRTVEKPCRALRALRSWCDRSRNEAWGQTFAATPFTEPSLSAPGNDPVRTSPISPAISNSIVIEVDGGRILFSTLREGTEHTVISKREGYRFEDSGK